ncbi:hypothetical protein ACIBMX_44355 [Streptomyces phaeochromogenes]|uniref:hypothetical protein n=1 Tax=Streptomyces phaeochromogenes TaxID=1923 RepID=UPI003792C1D9
MRLDSATIAAHASTVAAIPAIVALSRRARRPVVHTRLRGRTQDVGEAVTIDPDA